MSARRLAVAVLAAASLGAAATPAALAAPAERAFALSDNRLLSFDPAAPAAATTKPVTGVAAGETLVGIAVRPQDGLLYGLGVNATANTGTLYVIGRDTAQAGIVGSASGAIALTTDGAMVVDLPAAGYGFDVNPATDRIRVTTASGLNFRINPNTGGAVDGDNGGGAGSVTGLNPDGGTASVGGVAHTNSRPNTVVTTLYALSAATDQLTIQSPPNAGTQTAALNVTVAGTPVNFSAVGGFDIDPAVVAPSTNAPVTSGVGYAVLTIGAATHLDRLSLTDGVATDLGPIGDGSAAIQGLALQRDFEDAGFPAIGLESGGATLRRFQTATPDTSTNQALTGLTAGETMVAIAARPQTGQLYGLGINATANTGTLYLVDPQTGALSAVGSANQIALVNALGNPVDLPAASLGWGMDANPAADRIRVVANGALNFRINPNTGAPIDSDPGTPGPNPDGAHNGLPPGSTGVTATSYTNAFTQPLTGGPTTEYVLEPTANQLLIQNPPNNGTLTAALDVTLGGALLNFGLLAGFDIPSEVAVASAGTPATGSAIAALDVGGAGGLYSLDLATGAATLLGALPTSLAGLVVGDAQRDRPAPEPGPSGTVPPPTVVPIAEPIGAPLFPAPPRKDTTKPKVTKLAITAAKGRRLTISFTVSEAGRATIRLLRELPGRRAGKRCSATRKAGRRCTIRKAYGSITKVVAKAGKVTIIVKGKVGRKALVAGAARVEVTVRDAAGNRSALAAKGVRVHR